MNFMRNGIYCQVFDRWLLVDSKDFWITLETARVLSSKIATTVYVFPENELNNDNCLEYMLLNKTTEKRGAVADLISSQLPTLKFFGENAEIRNMGYPVDYEFDDLKKLQDYAKFVQRYVYAIEVSNAIANHHDNMSFANKYFPKNWIDDLYTYSDRTEFADGIFNELKRILYMSENVEEAKRKMTLALKKNYNKIHWIVDEFYLMLGEKHYFDKDERL